MAAPLGTEWFPFCVGLGDEHAENGARLLWLEHIHHVAATRTCLPRVSDDDETPWREKLARADELSVRAGTRRG